MTLGRRRLVATAGVIAVALLLRLAFPDAAVRREWSAIVLLPLGYGHVLGAMHAAWRNGPRGVVETLAGVVSALAVLSLLLPPVGLLVALAAIGIWHVLENEVATARAGADPARLAPVRLRVAGPVAVVASAATVVAIEGSPAITALAFRLGLPPAFATWTAEDLIALLLLHHVLSWALLVAVRSPRRALGWHGVPLALGLLAAVLAPATTAALASPLPYLVLSVAHAADTVRARRAQGA